jgi:DNA-binding HxlR family transcriptional regulator
MIRLKGKRFTCPIDVALHFISGKWKILILSYLYYGPPRRFFQIRDNLPGISEKVMLQQLAHLEDDGLIKKTIITQKPLTVEYSLTDKGETFAPVIKYLSEWGINYLMKNGIDYNKDQNLFKEMI